MAKDATANTRQQRRLSRLYETGIARATVLVHEQNRATFEVIRPLLRDPRFSESLSRAARFVAEEGPVNVAQVTQLSPFRYPGGKTWLIPEIRNWLRSQSKKPTIFAEPFAGGAIASLTVAAEGLAEHVYMTELDEDVSAVWETIFSEPDWLCKKIQNFDVTHENVLNVITKKTTSIKEKAFQTIVRNRTQRGGILAPGAGLVKKGENGKGLKSRWYPDTLAKRIKAIHSLRHKITFTKSDGFELISRFSKEPRAAFFIDPPYTVGGKSAGKRLYRLNEINHSILFERAKKVAGEIMMTYDDSAEVRKLAAKHSMKIDEIPMKNTHHALVRELVITKP